MLIQKLTNTSFSFIMQPHIVTNTLAQVVMPLTSNRMKQPTSQPAIHSTIQPSKQPTINIKSTLETLALRTDYNKEEDS